MASNNMANISKALKVQALARCSSKPKRGQLDPESTLKLSSLWSSMSANWSKGRRRARVVLTPEHMQELEEACPWLQQAVEDAFVKWVTLEDKLQALLAQGDHRPRGRLVVTLPCGARFAFRLRPFLAEIASNWGAQDAKNKLTEEQKEKVQTTCPWAMAIIHELLAYKPSREEKIQAFADNCSDGPPSHSQVIQTDAFAFKAGVFWACIRGHWAQGKPRTVLSPEEVQLIEEKCQWIQTNSDV